MRRFSLDVQIPSRTHDCAVSLRNDFRDNKLNIQCSNEVDVARGACQDLKCFMIIINSNVIEDVAVETKTTLRLCVAGSYASWPGEAAYPCFLFGATGSKRNAHSFDFFERFMCAFGNGTGGCLGGPW